MYALQVGLNTAHVQQMTIDTSRIYLIDINLLWTIYEAKTHPKMECEYHTSILIKMMK